MGRLSSWIGKTAVAAVSIVGIIVSSPFPAVAQDQNNPDVLRKELADSLAQLKAAQDRKNELATENEKLKAQIAAMQKDLDEVHRAQSTWSEQSYYLRAQRAAWEDFLERYPRLRAEWEVFLSAGPFASQNDLPQWADPLAAIATMQNGASPSTAPAATSTTTIAANGVAANPSTMPTTTSSTTPSTASVPVPSAANGNAAPITTAPTTAPPATSPTTAPPATSPTTAPPATAPPPAAVPPPTQAAPR